MDRRENSAEVNYRHSSSTRKHNEDRERGKHHSSTNSRQQDSKDSKDSRSPSRSRRHRSRSHSRERRLNKTTEQPRRHHGRSRSRSPNKKSYDRKTYDEKHDSHRSKRERRSRSRSSERAERNRERNKLEMRQLMAKNYEEQIAKIKNNAALKQKPHNAPVDPSKLVEQIERRKLLWSKKEKPADAPTSSTSVWNQTKFSDDCDGKVTAKFKRLMGMKEDYKAGSADSEDSKSDVVIRKQEEYFADLEKQYEVARATTHTQRGLGLGFSTRSYALPKSNSSSSKS